MKDIRQLIERIVATTHKGVVPQFTFVLLDAQAKQSQIEDYFGLLHSEVKNISGLDDAIAFLFDCDLFFWKVMEEINSLNHWRIVLKKEEQK